MSETASDGLASLVTTMPGTVPSNEFMHALRVVVEQGQRTVIAEYHEKTSEMFKNFEVKQSKFNAELNSTIVNMKNDIDDNARRIGLLEVEYSTHAESLDSVSVANNNLRCQVALLEKNLNKQKQYSLLSSLDVLGLSFKADED